MADPLAIIGGAIKTVQKLREVSQKVKDADTLNLIADLNLSLADLKLQFADLQNENLRLQEELKKSKLQSSFRDKLILKNGLYYFKVAEPNRSDGPYCTRCFDVDEKLVLVAALPRDFQEFGQFSCPNCKAHYT